MRRPARPAAIAVPTVDIGWHVFILYTKDYAEFCDQLAGRFIHHVPDDDPAGERMSGPAAVRRTVDVMRGLGLAVAEELWAGAGECTGSGTGKCSQCHEGCTDST